jgi:polyribonucleotide nucleotidyltransferase
MDAGVPVKKPVAGIAMGLIKEGDDFIILSDISGDEDHIGDMDFKVAGTAQGVTAIQMDIKVDGISREVLDRALVQAREGRMHILGKMAEVLDAPRAEISKYAPRIETIYIKTDKIRELIGPGGKVIRGIQEETGAKIEVDDSGKVMIFSADLEALQAAKQRVEEIGAEPEVGKVYTGTVRRIMEYGAFVQIIPGTDGLLHVTEIHSDGRIENVEDVLKEGDTIEVKVMSIDRQGKVKLSNREVVEPGSSPSLRQQERGERGPREPRGGDRDRGGFDRDRGPRKLRGGDRDRGGFGRDRGRGDSDRGFRGPGRGDSDRGPREAPSGGRDRGRGDSGRGFRGPGRSDSDRGPREAPSGGRDRGRGDSDRGFRGPGRSDFDRGVRRDRGGFRTEGDESFDYGDDNRGNRSEGRGDPDRAPREGSDRPRDDRPRSDRPARPPRDRGRF